MAIKNWTVTAETVDNAASREHYFSDEKAPSHKNTEGYIDVFGGERQTLEIIHRAEKRRLKMSMARKGGRPPKSATEFVVTLPKGAEFRPSKEQWGKMLGGLMTDAAKHLDVPLKTLSPIVRAYAHRQRDDGLKGAGDHMHIMMGHYDNAGEKLDLNKKAFLYMLKTSWNLQVKKHLGICNKTYEAKKTYDGQAKRRTPQWKVKAAREREAAAKDREDARLLYMGVRDKKNEMSMVLIPEFRKLSEKAEMQLKRLSEYIEAGNLSRVTATLNRLEKTSAEIGVFADAFVEHPVVMDLKSSIDNNIESVRSGLSRPRMRM